MLPPEIRDAARFSFTEHVSLRRNEQENDSERVPGSYHIVRSLKERDRNTEETEEVKKDEELLFTKEEAGKRRSHVQGGTGSCASVVRTL